MSGWFGNKKVEPKPLAPNVAVIGVRQAWAAQIGAVRFPLVAAVHGSTVTVASDAGVVSSFDAASGRELWRVSTGSPLAAGVGSDGTLAAVVGRNNELIALTGAGERWRAPLPADASTPPLVAGGRVFVLTADRALSAYDAQGGRRLWTQQRPTSEPLVLRQAGVLTAVGNTLVAGLGGRLVGLNPDSGSVLWEAPVAAARGTNDVERLIDLVAPVVREGSTLCARAFQAAVGCVDTASAQTLWSRPSAGMAGIAGDDERLFGTESNGVVQAWRRTDGERAWSVDRLQYRRLSAPLVLGRSVIFGDGDGLVHLFARTDGAPLNRLATDGMPIAVAPVAAGNTLVVVTQKGGVFGFVPQ